MDEYEDCPVGCECPVGDRALVMAQPIIDRTLPPIQCLDCGERVYGYSSDETLVDGRSIDAVLPL